jgi:hypothetical protein
VKWNYSGKGEFTEISVRKKNENGNKKESKKSKKK